ncbi:MAG: hypothetical protein LBU11_06950 [Zoogloeaceae bacterium]|jgi:hypothetical protein|nr:hypothetical protein [Zoogloeaceae bacterium]
MMCPQTGLVSLETFPVTGRQSHLQQNRTRRRIVPGVVTIQQGVINEAHRVAFGDIIPMHGRVFCCMMHMSPQTTGIGCENLDAAAIGRHAQCKRLFLENHLRRIIIMANIATTTNGAPAPASTNILGKHPEDIYGVVRPLDEAGTHRSELFQQYDGITTVGIPCLQAGEDVKAEQGQQATHGGIFGGIFK